MTVLIGLTAQPESASVLSSQISYKKSQSEARIEHKYEAQGHFCPPLALVECFGFSFLTI